MYCDGIKLFGSNCQRWHLLCPCSVTAYSYLVQICQRWHLHAGAHSSLVDAACQITALTGPDEGPRWIHESVMLSISTCMLACSHVQQGLCALLVFQRAVCCSCWLASLLQLISKVQVDWYENAYFSIVLQPLAYLYSCRLRDLAGVVVNSRMDDVSIIVAKETWP